MKKIKAAWDWFYTDKRTLRFALFMVFALMLVFAWVATGHAGIRFWNYQRQLPDIPAEVTFVVYENYDSVGYSHTDSAAITSAFLNYTFMINDALPYYVNVIVRWRGFEHPISSMEYVGNNWICSGDSINIPIRYYFQDSLTALTRTVLVGSSTYSSVTLSSPGWCDTGALVNGIGGPSYIRVPDTSMVQLVYTEYYGSDTSGFTDILVTQSPYVSSETVTDTLYDTLYQPAAPSSVSLCRVWGYVGELGGLWSSKATVTAMLDSRFVVDTCPDVLLFKKTVVDTTDSAGYFQLDLVRSSCLYETTHSSQAAKYLLIVHKPGMLDAVFRLRVPDSSTYKVTWR